MKKRWSAIAVSASLLLGGAVYADANIEATLKALQDQIVALNAKVKDLEAKKIDASAVRPVAAAVSKHEMHKKGKHHHHHHHHEMKDGFHHAAETAVREELDRRESQMPKGYFHVAGINTSIAIHGYTKLDTIYDTGPFTGDQNNLVSLPLKRFDPEANRLGHFRMHARESRLTLATLTPTKEMGDVATFFEADLYGSNNFASSSVNRSDSSAGSSYNFRMRKFYLDVAGFRIGQDWSTFVDADAYGGSMIEFNGPTGTSVVRQALIRYSKTFGCNKSWILSGAIENAYSEYTDQTGNRLGVNGNLNGSSGDGYQQLPDFAAKLRYAPQWGHIDLRGLVRQISIKNVSNATVRKRSRIGWGLGLSGKIQPTKKSNFYFNINAGDGIGRYIYDLVGQGAAFDANSGNFTTQFGLGLMAGYEYWFSDQWRANLAYGRTTVSLARFVSRNVTGTNVPITRFIDSTYINLIYKPLPKMDVGLEYAYYRRKTTGSFSGYGSRIQLGIKYSF